MHAMTKVLYFYIDGFKNMTTGKYLWKIILIKIFIILVLLNYFVYDKSFTTEFQTEEEKVNFVYKNLKGK